MSPLGAPLWAPLPFGRPRTAKAVLADGTEVSRKVHLCLIKWFGEIRELNVVANDGSNPLLGVGLLIVLDLFSRRDVLDVLCLLLVQRQLHQLAGCVEINFV